VSEFVGNDRFDVVRRLGTGGCGIVYEVVDRQRRARVALKTLSRLDAAALYRFKREFRALADVTHPNLVQLYELFAEQRGWFFTMELVPGRDFLGWVCNRSTFDTLDTISEGDTVDGQLPAGGKPALARIATGTGPSADATRLRAAIGELARGVAALHEAGMLHRDLKPNNVLVTETGRVVIVDYGLAAEIDEKGVMRTEAEGLVGTPAYMAPEQGDGGEIGPFSDWYAVGVMLYEALTGRLPFLGAPLQILSDKVRFEPPPPRELRKAIPEDLDRLCVDLLRRKPEGRPNGREVLRRLGLIEGAAPPVRTLQTHQTVTHSFVGRESALEQLRAAYERSREGACVRTWVKGPSGMGKTALVRRFLDELAHRQRPITLSARCYERETVPYKGFDGVVDELSRYLRALPRTECESLMPRDAAVLARVFPVLARVPAIADAPRRPTAKMDAQQMRSRAFVGLRDLLARIADRSALVISIDDVQWADVDSAALLAQLTAPPDAPSMMVILSYRSEDENGEIVRAFRQESGAPQRDDIEEINVDRLTDEEALKLAAILLGTDEDDAVGKQIAHEAAGSALFVGELVRYVQSSATRASSAGIRLERVLRERVEDQAEAARDLLDVLSISARPLHPEIARQAAGLDADQGMQALTALRLAHFVRTSGANERRVVEVNHGRVREAALSLLSDEEQKELHGRLADTLRAAGGVDPELLFTHFRAAGRDERAIEYAELAAAKAERALAFDRAAYFYRYVIDARGPEDPSWRGLWKSLATVLAYSGRGAEAADAFLAAAPDANEAERLELQRRAAEQLLQSGHIDRGMEVVQTVLNALGMSLPKTPRSALLSLIVLRIWLSIRLALSSKPALRDESTIAASALTRMDVCWSIGVGLAAVDTIRAAQSQTRNAIYSINAREPKRLARSLALEVILQATSGPKKHAGASRILERVNGVLAATNDATVRAYERLAAAGLAYFTGHFRDASTIFTRDYEVFLGAGITDGRWEENTFDYFGLCATMFLGGFAEATKKLPPLVRQAEERGDLYLHTNLRVGDTNLLWLVHDDPDGAERVVNESMGRWSRRSFQTQHYYELQARANVDLYRGDIKSALDRMTAGVKELRRAMQMRIFVTRLKANHTLARAAIRVAIETKNLETLHQAQAVSRLLHGEPNLAAPAIATLIDAGIIMARGDGDRAVSKLREAAAALERADLSAYARSARIYLGRALAGDEGREMTALAEKELRNEGVRDVDKLAALFVAGF
jgi:eukaryotic-like serine/threonine-protein kinase